MDSGCYCSHLQLFERVKIKTIQYAQKQLKTIHNNATNLTKIVHIAQMSTDRIRILFGEREYMRTIYIADDGKEFDNEFDCEHYEWTLNHPNLKYIKIYDNRTGELFDDIMTDDTYNYGDKVVIPTEFALKDLHDWATYSGYCYFHQITEVGTWVFNEDENAYEKVGG